eukprot:9466512-Pyramimonas_sp.AAC.1
MGREVSLPKSESNDLIVSLAIGSVAKGIRWKPAHNDYWTPHTRNPLKSTTQGLDWNSSQQKSVGKH